MRIFKGIVILFWLGGVASAQPGWGPDIPVTHYTITDSAGPYSPRISASPGVLHVVWWEAGTDSLGSYEDVFYVRSSDSGAHWSEPAWLSPRDNKGDVGPSIAAGVNDIHVVWSRFSGDVCYRKSTDGGSTWGTIDTTLLWRGRHPQIAIVGDSLYLVAVGQNDRLTYFRKSTNHGSSWLPTVTLGPGWQQPQVLVQRNLVHVFVEVLRPNAGEVFYTRSTDGGQTWASMWMMSSDDNRNSIFPCLTGRDTLNVYAVWMDRKYSPYDWTGDIFIRRSTDGGATWAPEESLTVEHRAMDSDAIAQGDTLHVVTEDERVDPGRNFELFYRMSTDRGLNWGQEERLTYAPRNSYGPCLSRSTDLLHLVWWDDRDDTTNVGLQNVFYKQKTLFSSGVERESLTKGSAVRIDILPNPSRSHCRIRILGMFVGQALVYDATGRVVRRLYPAPQERSRNSEAVLSWDGRDEKGKEVSSGVYFLRINSNRKSIARKIVVLR